VHRLTHTIWGHGRSIVEPQCFILALQFIMQNTYPISGTYVKDRNTAASVGQLICRRISVCTYGKQYVMRTKYISKTAIITV